MLLVGNSGGAALAAFYQAEAERFSVVMMADGERTGIVPSDLWVDPALDIYDRANWHKDGVNPLAYSADFLCRFMGTQRARRDRIEARTRAPRRAALHARPQAAPLAPRRTVSYSGKRSGLAWRSSGRA